MKQVFIIIVCLLSACSGKNVFFSEENAVLPDSGAVRRDLTEIYHNTLSLEQLIEIAKERNLDLQIAVLKQELARIDKQIAIGNLLPQVDILAGFEKNYDNLHLGVPTKLFGLPYNMAVPLLGSDFYAYSLNAQIPVFVPSLWFLVSARKKGEDIQELLTSLSGKLVTLNVMSEYFYFLALQSEEKSLYHEKQSSHELLRQAEISFRTESILAWELEEARAYDMSKELALRQNKRAQEIAYLDILKSLNFPFDVKIDFIPLEEKIVILPSVEECVLQALEHNEKWKVSNVSKQIREDVKRSALSEFLPKIILGGNVFGFDNNLLLEDSGSFLSVIGLFSVFNGFKTVNEYRKALRQEKISEIELIKEYWTLIAEIHSAYNSVQNAKELFLLSKTNMEAMQGKFNQKKAEQKYGVIDLKEYYSALKEYHEAISFHEKAYFQYRLAAGTLAVAMGQNPYQETEL